MFGRPPSFSRKWPWAYYAVKNRLFAARRRDVANCVISVIHPTRRPLVAIDVRRQWLESASDASQIEYIFAIDEDDPESIKHLEGYRRVIVPPGGRAIRPINEGARASTGDILLTAMDDVEAPPRWDQIVRERLPEPRERSRVLGVSDGYRKDRLLVTSVLTRKRYEKQGHILDPAYEAWGVYADNEFTDRAYKDGEVIEAFDVIFRHNHPVFTNKEAELDEVYKRHNNDECYRLGYEVYKQRNP